MASLHYKRRRVSKWRVARGANLLALNQIRSVQKRDKIKETRLMVAQRAKADVAAAVVATECSAESIDVTSLTAVDALMECSRPHLPRRRFYRPRLLWVGCGSGTEALSLFAMHRGGGRATLVEHVAELARAAHLAVATRAGKPQALIGEELVMNGWHVRVITANILEQQPEFFVGFNIVYTFAGSTSSTRSPAPRTTPWRGAWPRRPGQLGRSW